MLATLAEEAPRFFGYYNMLLLGGAFLMTLGLSVVGCGIGFLAGFGLAVLRNRHIVRVAPLRWLAVAYVEVFRRIPFLVKLMCVFFAFQLAGADAGLFTIAATTVALSAAAFSAENVRAGLEGVNRTQWEAAATMNMGGLTCLRLVVLPQAWGLIVPPSMTYAVGLIKSTSIASQIGIVELTYAAKTLNGRGFSATICFGAILVLYFVICFTLNRAAVALERRLSRRGPRLRLLLASANS